MRLKFLVAPYTTDLVRVESYASNAVGSEVIKELAEYNFSSNNI